jgi:hypothetical protein
MMIVVLDVDHTHPGKCADDTGTPPNDGKRGSCGIQCCYWCPSAIDYSERQPKK